MSITTICPDASELKKLRLGQLPLDDVERLAEHLEQCSQCVASLQELNGEDTLIESMRLQAQTGDQAEMDVVQGLMDRLKQFGPAARLAMATAPSSATGSCAANEVVATGFQPVGTGKLETCRHISRAALSSRTDGQSVPPATPRVSFDFLAPPQEPDELGRLGPYRISKVLGAGGMGIVFQAEDPQLKRPVALKALKPILAASEPARQRFLREAQATAAIKHDHIVTIYQVGEDRGVPFLAMEFLEGEPLDARLNREGRLAVSELVRVGREVAEGLAAAHKRGLIHRDIKPGNIWLEGDTGRVRILDFGLSLAVGDEVTLTEPGMVAGTPAYMAPEQVRGEGIDNRSDLFSLGCMLYRACTGLLPFQARDTMFTLLSVALEQPRSPRHQPRGARRAVRANHAAIGQESRRQTRVGRSGCQSAGGHRTRTASACRCPGSSFLFR